MPIYRLRAAKRDSNGVPGDPLWDDQIEATDDADAIRKARLLPVDRFIDDTDYAWLTDHAGRAVWSLKLEEVTELPVET